MKKTLLAGLLLGAGCPLAAQDAEPAAAAPVPQMGAFHRADQTPALGAGGAALLRRPALDAARRAIPAEAFPQHLLAAPGIRVERVEVMVSLDQSGAATACTLQGGETYSQSRRLDEPVSAELGAKVCAMALENFGYHHALDHSGRPVAADVALVVEFGWENYWRTVPSLGPRARQVISVGGWPATYLPDGPVTLALAEVGEIDAGRRDQGQVGVLLSSDREGALTACVVAKPSGVPAYDEASCRAFAGTGQRPFLLGFPVLLHWAGQAMRTQLPEDVAGPVIINRTTPDPAMIAGIELPERPVIGLELTVSPEGSLAGCVVSRPSYVDALDAASCALFGVQTRFTVPRGNFGEPVAGRFRMEVDWRRLLVTMDGW